MAMPHYRKPEWLRKPIRLSQIEATQQLLRRSELHTVCEEAMCPNIGECFAHNVATFLILGDRCTRACTFCAVTKAQPLPPDPSEPERVAEAVRVLGLRHVVITSPTRDDLSDGGSGQFCATVKAIKRRDSAVRVELLIPDFREDFASIAAISNSGADIVGHNIETVPRLYAVRAGSSYVRSLRVLERIRESNHTIATKSAIMLGLGELEEEVLGVMEDLRQIGCRYLSIGQYLAPTVHHTPVLEYVSPERFEHYRLLGLRLGFEHVKSSPYTRSSYMAHEYIPAQEF